MYSSKLALLNSGYRAELAIDPDSDDVLEEFRCPVCLEIFLDHIYQCGSGHTICNSCRVKCASSICAQCRGEMTTSEGNWIRNLALEKLLDKMWINCPFRIKGCNKILSRCEVEIHSKNCVYNDDAIQLCEHMYLGDNCNFRINRSQPKEILKHFEDSHKPCLGVFNYGGEIWVSIQMLGENINYPVCVTQNGHCVLLIIRIDTSHDSVFLMGINLDPPICMENQQKPVEFEVQIGKVSSEIKGLKAKIPVVPFRNAIKALISQSPVVCLRKSILSKHVKPDFFADYVCIVNRISEV